MKIEQGSQSIACGTRLPTLEDDIADIQELHRFRRTAKDLRDRGVEALSSVMAQDEVLLKLKNKIRQEEIKQIFSESYRGKWGNVDSDEPAGFFLPAVTDLAVDKNLKGARAARKQTIRRLRKGTERLPRDIATLIPSKDWEDASKREPNTSVQRLVDSLTLARLFSRGTDTRSGPRRLPILEVARMMQDLVRHPSTVFTQQSFICYFVLVRELYQVVAPNWKAGSATAIHGGVASAYMTSECVRALSAFARTLDTTAQVLRRAVGARKEAHDLERNRVLLSPQWVSYEQKRILFSLIAYLRENEANISFRVSLKDICHRLEERQITSSKALEKIVQQFLDDATKSVAQARDGIAHARSQIEKFSFDETSQVSQFLVDAATSVAKKVLDNGEIAIGEIDQKINQANQANLEPIEQIAEMLARQASQIRRLLEPSLGFLESILDRELTRASLGSEIAWNPAELAFSAAALSALGHHDGDPRLPLARRILQGSLTQDGDFPLAGVLESDFLGYGLVVVRAEIIRALAQLLEASDEPIETELVKKMLERFRLTKIEEPGDSPDRVGWAHDNPRFPARKLRWTTGISILALDRIVRMLNKRINSRVLRHFSVKNPRDLGASPPLEKLFYADYGMALNASNDDLEYGRMESVAYDLLQVFCHVKGEVPLPDLTTDRPAKVSAVLFGPPGTGKTTLVEALAESAEVPLVVVTPSDIVVSGEAGLERRARAVFTALQALSGAVILFDEFEPVLRSRRKGVSDRTSVFHFLTPGMLPKLKDLHVAATSSRVGFFLVTNLLGELDEAAIRSGRFDKQIGVFPPNPTARSGQLMKAFLNEDQEGVLEGDPERGGTKKEEKERFLEVIAKTSFGSIGHLARKGWFLPTAKSEERGEPLDHVKNGTLGMFEAPEIDMRPDYLWESEEDQVSIRISEKEVELWSHIHSWELTLWLALRVWCKGKNKDSIELPNSIERSLRRLEKLKESDYEEFTLPVENAKDVLSWIRQANEKGEHGGEEGGPRRFSNNKMLPAYKEKLETHYSRHPER